MRIDPVAPGTRPELADLEQRIVAERGRVSPLYQVLLNSPPLAHGWEQMLTAVRNRSSLPADVRELVILRVAVLNRAHYEFEAHVPHALAAGVLPEALEAMRQVPLVDLGGLTVPQRIAIGLADTMTREIEVPDAQYEQVRSCFGPRSQLELVATIAAYNMVSRLLVALQIGR